jgi:hypothetical protein
MGPDGPLRRCPEDARSALSDVICRCTGYTGLARAAAGVLSGATPEDSRRIEDARLLNGRGTFVTSSTPCAPGFRCGRPRSARPGARELLLAVAGPLRELALDGVPVVVDPVMVTTAGSWLSDLGRTRAPGGRDAVPGGDGDHAQPAELSEEVTLEINQRGSIQLAELAREAGVARFVFASSCSVYGDAHQPELTEDGEVRPLTAYARSKLVAERAIVAFDDLCATALRFATLFGASPALRNDLMVNRMVGTAARFGKITATGDGAATRPLLHVRDGDRQHAGSRRRRRPRTGVQRRRAGRELQSVWWPSC